MRSGARVLALVALGACSPAAADPALRPAPAISHEDAVHARLRLYQEQRREFRRSAFDVTVLGPDDDAVRSVTPGKTEPVWIARLGRDHVVLGLDARGDRTMTIAHARIIWAGDLHETPQAFPDRR